MQIIYIHLFPLSQYCFGFFFNEGEYNLKNFSKLHWYTKF